MENLHTWHVIAIEPHIDHVIIDRLRRVRDRESRVAFGFHEIRHVFAVG